MTVRRRSSSRRRPASSLFRRVLTGALFLSPFSLLLLCSSPASAPAQRPAVPAATPDGAVRPEASRNPTRAAAASVPSAPPSSAPTGVSASAPTGAQSTVRGITDRLRKDEFFALADHLSRCSAAERERLIATAVDETRRVFAQLQRLPAPVSRALIHSAPAQQYIQRMMDKFNGLKPAERQALAPLMREIVAQLEHF